MKKNEYKEMIKSMFNKSNKYDSSHLIIIINNDEFIFESIYVKRKENIKDVIFKIIQNENYEIKEIYNYDIPLESQLEEKRAYNIFTPYDKVEKAFRYASKKHTHQKRKNNDPYIVHPQSVAQNVEKFLSNNPRLNELLAAAFLHDTVEDTDTTIEDIKIEFGEYVAYLVSGVTNDPQEKQKIGKTNYLCKKMLDMPDDVLELKLCDRLSNVVDLKNSDEQFRNKYTIETKIIIAYLRQHRNLSQIQERIISEIESQLSYQRTYSKV